MRDIKYYVKGTLKGSVIGNDYTTDNKLCNYELLQYLDKIKALFTRDPIDNLAQYIHDKTDGIEQGVIKEIWVDVKLISEVPCSWTEIIATRELTDDEKTNLLEYLTGQFSDGYGEGLEQREFHTYKDYEEYEEYDEETGEQYLADAEIYYSCYLHLWQDTDFKLEFADCTEIQEEDE